MGVRTAERDQGELFPSSPMRRPPTPGPLPPYSLGNLCGREELEATVQTGKHGTSPVLPQNKIFFSSENLDSDAKLLSSVPNRPFPNYV